MAFGGSPQLARIRRMVRLLSMSLILAILTGCKSKPAVAPRPAVAPVAKAPAAPEQISKERAVEIVRELLAKESPKMVVECKVSESADGFSVFAILSFRDESGELYTYPGGHCTYVLSKSGKITETHPGL